MKNFIFRSEYVAIAVFFLSTQIACKAEPTNIVVILADDCTFRDIGCYGGQALTPNIDKLAGEGLKFERCFQAAPMCSPTRHSLYTGLYPVKSGAYPNHTMIYPDVRTIAQYLKPLGYQVAHTGKLHVNPRENFPWKRIGKGWKISNLELIDDFLVEQSRSKEPFCFFFCSNSPHSPWDEGDSSKYLTDKVKLPPYLVDTPKVRSDFCDYLAEVTHFDWQVGEVVRMLDRHNLANSTLVMVLSEQGNSFPFAKWNCYDHGLQSAMVVRWPGHVQPGSVSRAMVDYVDITPTLVEIGGGRKIEGLDGKSLLPVLQGETDHHRDYVYGIMTTRGIRSGSEAYAIRSIRSERFKLILNLNHESEFKNVAMQSGYYKSMLKKARAGDATAQRLNHAYSFRPPVELFDLETDPLELENIAVDPKHAQTVAKLKIRLEDWMCQQGDLGVPTEKTAHLRQIKNIDNNRRFDPMEVLKPVPDKESSE